MRTTQLVEIDKITIDPNQPRKVILEKSVEHLAMSLRVEGLIHAIELDENFRIIVGEMRYRAAKLLGWKEISATVNKTPMSPYERLRRQMAENLQQSGSKGGGEAMNPIDTAKAWARLYELKTGTRYQPGLQPHSNVSGPFLAIAQEVGVSKETVWEYVKLLNESKTVIEDMLKGRPRTYYRDASLASPELQKVIKKKIAKGQFANRDQVAHIVALEKNIPELARMNLDRDFIKESIAVNRILTSIITVSLALVAIPLKNINRQEQKLVRTQLEWLQEKIENYISEGGE